MPPVIITEGAAGGLECCRQFLAEKNPHLGRPFADIPELGELVVAFGDSAYVVLYRYESDVDRVYVFAFAISQE